jgi:hypothetical protein
MRRRKEEERRAEGEGKVEMEARDLLSPGNPRG